MSDSTPHSYANRLLQALPGASLAALAPHLEPLAMRKGDVLIEAGSPFTWAYFPGSGLASIVSHEDGHPHEVGLYGRDGMGSVGLVLGVDRSLNETVVQVPGHGHRIAAGALHDAMTADAALRALLLRYVQCLLSQVAHTALSNSAGSTEGRLARWLLLTHDRTDGDELLLTHEFLGIMLGVRRPSVTLATHVLEGMGAIRAKRGAITVIDRAKLAALAGDAYGPAEGEYERLIGPLR